MEFNEHKKLEGKHAILSPSNHHWLNYSDDKLEDRWRSLKAVERGTELHAFAAMAIKLGITQKRNGSTINTYINDGIGYHMTPEQPLMYSDNCFGTADAICFRDGLLRIHDLKTGDTPAKMDQLRIYAALFCLEYDIRPGEIDMELRIYQFGERSTEKPLPEDILPIMDKIQRFDKILERLNNGG